VLLRAAEQRADKRERLHGGLRRGLAYEQAGVLDELLLAAVVDLETYS